MEKNTDPTLTPQLLINHCLFFVLSTDDHSRVRLLVLDGDPHSDYINANYIDVSILMELSSSELLTVQARNLTYELSLTCPLEGSQSVSKVVYLFLSSCDAVDYPKLSALWSPRVTPALIHLVY